MNQNSGTRKSITEIMGGNCLIEAMESVREVCSIGHGIRAKENIRARQPLEEMKIVDPDGKWTWLAYAPDMVFHIKNEVNVKNIVIYYDGMDIRV